ncbi:hypothetical protein OsJ_22990 [Oryza sativa Japonica Group]|uniref:Uncharacterized protein n=1 Tax=Oryza sativa subsp. japonica TaxID=39947 RepID=B9FVC9_ORYSJ|nr:hypothetical protein OsJ_22990 [Oryza sativa Japonica Group]
MQYLDGDMKMPELIPANLSFGMQAMMSNEGFDSYMMSYPSSSMVSHGTFMSGLSGGSLMNVQAEIQKPESKQYSEYSSPFDLQSTNAEERDLLDSMGLGRNFRFLVTVLNSSRASLGILSKVVARTAIFDGSRGRKCEWIRIQAPIPSQSSGQHPKTLEEAAAVPASACAATAAAPLELVCDGRGSSGTRGDTDDGSGKKRGDGGETNVCAVTAAVPAGGAATVALKCTKEKTEPKTNQPSSCERCSGCKDPPVLLRRRSWLGKMKSASRVYKSLARAYTHPPPPPELQTWPPPQDHPAPGPSSMRSTTTTTGAGETDGGEPKEEAEEEGPTKDTRSHRSRRKGQGGDLPAEDDDAADAATRSQLQPTICPQIFGSRTSTATNHHHLRPLRHPWS